MRISIAVGDNPLTRRLWERGEIRVEEVDLLYAGERQRTRILLRTARGLDYLGMPFAPYSEKGPYYYYPQVRGYKGERRAIVSRFAFRVGGGTVTRGGVGIRYDSYAAFKRALGRTNVDLTGPRAPHMMQALVVRVENGSLAIGIWGPEAARAEGHNEGIPGRLPRRRFLDISPLDLEMIGQDVADMISLRLAGEEPRLLR